VYAALQLSIPREAKDGEEAVLFIAPHWTGQSELEQSNELQNYYTVYYNYTSMPCPAPSFFAWLCMYCYILHGNYITRPDSLFWYAAISHPVIVKS
jgi:hypothetical protein